MSPILLFLLIILLAVFVGLIVSALRNRIIFKMGTRNIGRRKGNTIIVIIGLMIGTAIIMASLTIGDTMENMVDRVVVDGMGEVDLMVVDISSEAERTYLPYDDYQDLKTEIQNIPHVEGVSGEFSSGLPVLCFQSNQSEPTMSIMGVEPSELDEFGGISVDGRKIDFDLAAGEVYINEHAASVLDAEVGYFVQIINSTEYNFTNPPPNFRIKDIVDAEGYTNWNLRSHIIVNIEVAWSLFEVDEVVNTIKITNEGDEITGAEHSDDVQKSVKLLIQDYPNLEAVGNKREVIESNREGISQLTDLFLVFGTFTIIAGVILIINIFVMLAEERKTEMGISRAVGMKRKHLKRMFLYPIRHGNRIFCHVGYSGFGQCRGAVHRYSPILHLHN
jgi:putative ABC transport system permease protein